MKGNAFRRTAVAAVFALVSAWSVQPAVAQAPVGAELRDRPVRVESEGVVEVGKPLDGRVFGLVAAKDGDVAKFTIEASGDGGKDFGQHFKLQTWSCATGTWTRPSTSDELILTKDENGWRFRLAAEAVDGAPEVNPIIVGITLGEATVRFGVVVVPDGSLQFRQIGEPSMALSTTLLENDLMPIELGLHGRVDGFIRLGMSVALQSGGSSPIADIYWKLCGPGWAWFDSLAGLAIPQGTERLQLAMTNLNQQAGLHGCVVFFHTKVDGKPVYSRPFGFVVSGMTRQENKPVRQPWERLQIGEPSMAVSKGTAYPGVLLEVEIPMNGKTKQEERLKILFDSAQKTGAADMGKIGRWQYLDVDAQWKDYDAKVGVPVPEGVEQVHIGFMPEGDPAIDPALNKKEAFTFKVYFDKWGARPSPTPPKTFGIVVHDK